MACFSFMALCFVLLINQGGRRENLGEVRRGGFEVPKWKAKAGVFSVQWTLRR